MIRFFFGVPGSGKTTVAVKLIYQELKSQGKLRKYKFSVGSEYVYSNIGDKLARSLDPRNLEFYKPPSRSSLFIDESGIEFNSRNFKKFSQGHIEYFKKHRHNYDNIFFFSQGIEDTDKIIRDLSVEWWAVHKIGPLTICRRYFHYIVPPSEHTNFFPIYGLKRKSPLWQLLPMQPKQFMFCWRPKYMKYFDSHAPIDRPMREDLSIYDPPKVTKKTVARQLD